MMNIRTIKCFYRRNYFTEAAAYVSAGRSGSFGNPAFVQKCSVCEELSFGSIYNLEENMHKPKWLRSWIESMNDDRIERDKDIYIIREVFNLPFTSGCGIDCCFDKNRKNSKKPVNQ